MANSLPEIESGFPTTPSLATDPPPTSRRRTQLQSLFDRRKELTKEEKDAILKTISLSYFTTVVITAIFSFIILFGDRLLHCHVRFSVESISVSPSSTTWHVDFLVNNPSSRCPIYYDGDGVYAKLGSLYAAVLKTSHKRRSHGRTSFSVDLATEGNQSDVVAAFPSVFELGMKLSAKKKKLFVEGYYYGYFDIRCQNLTPGYEKIKCHSSFKKLKDCCEIY
ncbi:unnamed protein product [Thlaspi arvense]|uniref:Late embryogenesis abundant protein LEA-2 subgroup domain-containing protein n=1 Tax=Thlaspi arvense TaxID=13288 RepID=A0AAU9SW09_THLAR|nr:unnamed protein product [Thlaspi arvense]